MSVSGHNQRQVSATIFRTTWDDLIVDTLVPLRGEKIPLALFADMLYTCFLEQGLLILS